MTFDDITRRIETSHRDRKNAYAMRATSDRMNPSLISVDVNERLTPIERGKKRKKEERPAARPASISFAGRQAGTRIPRTRNRVKLRRGWRREAGSV